LSVLKVENLRKTYSSEGFLGTRKGKVEALKGVGFEIGRGEVLALVGESGSGKTTAAKIICGLENPDSGLIKWRVSRPHPAQMVFQNPLYSLNPKLSIKSCLYEALGCAGVPRGKRPARASELLRGAGLEKINTSKYPHQFSGGQKQRIAILRALALEPELLVCDEPVSALDISVQAQVINFLKDINSSAGLPIIFIAHDLEAVSMIADRVAVMKEGLIVEEGPAAEVITSPRNSYTRKLLDSVPVNPWLSKS